MPPEQLVSCWLKADVLPLEAVAEVRRRVHRIETPFDNAHMAVSDIVAMMANVSLSEEFQSMEASDRARAVRRWLAAEDDLEAIDETMDMVLGGEDDGK